MTGVDRSKGRPSGRFLLGIVVGLWASAAAAQYCPGGSTYFATNYFAGCTVGSCWAATPFVGSSPVSGDYPSTQYACATTTPPAGQTQNTLHSYDNNGNLVIIKDPLNRQSTHSYDALNRLIQVLDPNSGITSYGFDAAGELTQVIDPNGLATTYAYNGLGNVIQQVSPDTGTTGHTYDAAGNLLTRTDARGVTATFTYDALNRVTQAVYSKSGTPSETHVYTYDVGANAKGRLSQVVDPAATTSWTYNAQGRVASKSQLTGTLVRTIGYGYNGVGQLTTLTTPSGQVIGYGYVNNRVSTITVNGQTLLTQGEAMPFGPLGAWQWGNGLNSYRDYDTDGRLVTWEFRNGTSVLRRDQTFDAASRITALSDPNNPALSQTYQYDALDRLTRAQTGNPATGVQQFGYDFNGNRIAATMDANQATLVYAPDSNRLQTMVGSVSASYLNGATALAFTYNNANRLVLIQSGGLPLASYAVSALGQRVSKVVNGITTAFAYDEQGRLIGEYDGSGNLIQETVWLEDLPVATLRPTGGGSPPPIAIYYVHVDHLGSPRAVTRPSDNALMWRWDNVDPFGANPANEDPSGQGVFKYNLRFPGQYYDAETGLHYNYFRDYDPAIGRYIESDPIGLDGGVNTFAYVQGNPIGAMDPDGLLKRGSGCSPSQWARVVKAEQKIRSELGKPCACDRSGSGTCIPCDMRERVRHVLDTTTANCSRSTAYCGQAVPGGSSLEIMLPGFNNPACCLPLTIYHELLHTAGFSHRDPGDPVTRLDERCQSNLCN